MRYIFLIAACKDENGEMIPSLVHVKNIVKHLTVYHFKIFLMVNYLFNGTIMLLFHGHRKVKPNGGTYIYKS